MPASNVANSAGPQKACRNLHDVSFCADLQAPRRSTTFPAPHLSLRYDEAISRRS
jgi:hypothetical protein